MSRLSARQKSLYRILLCDPDPKGQRLTTFIHDLGEDDGLTISEEPNIVIPHEIGFERNCDPEIVFEAGIKGDRYVLRLLGNPTFPFWLSSSLISQ